MNERPDSPIPQQVRDILDAIHSALPDQPERTKRAAIFHLGMRLALWHPEWAVVVEALLSADGSTGTDVPVDEELDGVVQRFVSVVEVRQTDAYEAAKHTATRPRKPRIFLPGQGGLN